MRRTTFALGWGVATAALFTMLALLSLLEMRLGLL
jgi:hypothetical protein